MSDWVERYFQERQQETGQKYSPDQPRVAAGDPRGGQWALTGGRPGGSIISQNDFKSPDEQSTGDVRRGAARRLAGRWQAARPDLEVMAQEEGYIKNIQSRTDDELKYRLVDGILQTWEASSGDILGVVMAKHIADRLGREYELTPRQQSSYDAIQNFPGAVRAARGLADAMYDMTQEWLRERGVKKLQLLRSGHRGESSLHTSWSLGWGGVRHGQGKVIIETVRAEDVLSVPPTGFGTLAESEVVVLPRR